MTSPSLTGFMVTLSTDTAARGAHINLMFKFHRKMIVQIHFNREFARNNPLMAPGFEPMAFQLTSSWCGMALYLSFS